MVENEDCIKKNFVSGVVQLADVCIKCIYFKVWCVQWVIVLRGIALVDIGRQLVG